MSVHPERRRALTPEQEQERFSVPAGVAGWEAVVALALAGGPDDGGHTDDAEREAKK